MRTGWSFGLVVATLATALACTGCSGAGQTSNVANASGGGNAATTSNAANAPTNAAGDVTDVPVTSTLPDGWYQASLTTNTNGSTPAFTTASVDDDALTVAGIATYAASEDDLPRSSDRVGPGTWTVPLAPDVVLESSGGTTGRHSLDRTTFDEIVSLLNGLGLVIHVEGGTVTYARVAS